MHHQNQKFVLKNIDLDCYSCGDLLSDVRGHVLKNVLGSSNDEISLSCDIPESMETMCMNSDSHILEMFNLHKNTGLINVYVWPMIGNIVVNMNDVWGNIGETDKTSYVMSQKNTSNKSKSTIRKSQRLNKWKQIAHYDDLGADDIESSDDLNAFSDGDEMPIENDDDLFSAIVSEGLESESQSSEYLSDYESDNNVEIENDSDGEFENDLMGSCLNAA